MNTMAGTEAKLKLLMDYQKFAKNPRLEAMLAQTQHIRSIPIGDDCLADVNAAGDPTAGCHSKRKDPQEP